MIPQPKKGETPAPAQREAPIGRHRIRENKTGSPQLPEKIRTTRNEPIRCASPPCYLSEIED
jgi:hypothetical protein